MAQRYFTSLLRWRWILVISTIIAAGMAFWITKDQPIIYTTRASLMIGPGIDTSNPDLDSLRTGGQLMQTYAELPKTAPFLMTVIDDLEIDITPEELLEFIQIQASDVNQILRIEVAHVNPELAIAIANVIAETLVQVSPSNPENTSPQHMDLIHNQIVFTEESIASTKTRIQQIEADIASVQLTDEADPDATGMIGSIAMAENRLKEFETRLQATENQAAMLQEGTEILEELRENTTQRSLSLETDLRNAADVNIQKLIIARLTSERVHLSNLQRAIQEMQRPISSLTIAGVREIEAEREDNILEQIADERNLLSEMQQFDVERRIAYQTQLEEQRKSLDELSQTLSKLYASLQEASPNQVTIIEPGNSAIPGASWLWLKVMISGAAGLIASALVIVGLEFLSDTIETPDDLEMISGIPVMGVISNRQHNHDINRSELIVTAAPDSRTAEDYRILSTKLLLTHNSSPIQSLVLTAAEAKKDASEVSSNLAVVLSQAGKKVFFIDANLNASKRKQFFDSDGKLGLTEVLSEPYDDLKLSSEEGYPNLNIIPVDVSPSKAFELLTSAQMKALIEKLVDQGGFVLINAPSILASADSLYLSSQVDGVVMVAYLSQTTQKNIKSATENLKTVGAHPIGCILVGRRSRKFPLPPERPTKKSTKAVEQGSKSETVDGKAKPQTEAPALNLTRSNIRGSSLLLIGRIIAMGINFGVQVLTVRYLSKSDYGAFAYALSVIAMTVMVAQFGLDKAIVRFVPIYHEQKDYKKMFGTIMMTICAISGIGFAIILLFSVLRGFINNSIINDPLSVGLLLLLIALTPINALDNVFQGLLAVFAKPRAIFFRRHILGPSLKLIVILLVIAARSNVYFLAAGYLLGGLLGVIVYVMMLRRVLQETDLIKHFNLREMKIPAREILSFSIPLLSSDMVAIGRTTLVVVLLEHFRSATSVADYRAIVPLAGLNLVVLQSFKYLYSPLAARMLARDDQEGINKLYWQTAVWIAVITFPIFVLSFSMARPLVILVLGERYAESGLFLALLAFGNYFNAALGFNTYTLRVYGKVGYIVLADVITTAACLGLSLLLIPRYGALGAAISASGTLVIYNLLNHAGLVLRTGIDLFQRRYLRVYLSIIISALILFFVQEFLSPAFIVSILLTGLVSLALVLFNRHALDIAGMFPELGKIPLIRPLLGL